MQTAEKARKHARRPGLLLPAISQAYLTATMLTRNKGVPPPRRRRDYDEDSDADQKEAVARGADHASSASVVHGAVPRKQSKAGGKTSSSNKARKKNGVVNRKKEHAPTDSGSSKGCKASGSEKGNTKKNAARTTSSKTRKNEPSKDTKEQKPQQQQQRSAAISAGPFPLYSANPSSTISSTSSLSSSEGIASIVNLLSTKKNIVVLAGAGISTSSGIPDFRSKNTGLYETLDIQSLGLSCAEDLFCQEQFLHDPRPFYRFSRNLYPAEGGELRPTPAHRFLALLHERGMLRRVYTQNVDSLEERAGVPTSKIVQTHGSLNWASCLKCKRKVDVSDIIGEIRAGRVPRCRKERKNSNSKKTKARSESLAGEQIAPAAAAVAAPLPNSIPKPPPKRQRRQTSKMSDSGWSYADDAGDFPMDEGVVEDPEGCCGGVLKPGITFFGEKLAGSVAKRLEKDRAMADAIIVMGTSLSVAPMSKVIQYLSPSIPRILVNRNIVKALSQHVAVDKDGDDDDEEEEEDTRDGYVFDACLLGFCDDVSRALVKEMERDTGEGENASKSEEANKDDAACEILCNVEEQYKAPDDTIRGLHHHPNDRIFLFPGAVIHTDGNDSDSDITYKEVAQCDGCQNEIQGNIMKCSECFDFDLCMTCYPQVSLEHFDGKHAFIEE